ncbi:hypothetical protein [Persephonella sp.]
MDILEKNIKDPQKIQKAVSNSLDFIKNESEKFTDFKEILNKKYIEEKRNIEKFVKQNFKNLTRWEIRSAVSQIFDKLQIKLEEDTPEKIIFMLFTDVLSELQPSPSPLIFFYEGNPLVKKHGVIVEFNLMPELLNKIEDLDAYKKHQIVLDLFPEDEIVTEGVSLKLAQLNFLILNLFDRAVYENVVPVDRLIIQKDGKLTVDKNFLIFSVVSIFASLYEAVAGEKQQFKGSFYTADLSKYFVKIKGFVKKVISDRDEFDYILYASKLEEEGIENRLITIRDYQTQKNVFEESIRRNDVDTYEKIESIFWLLGVENINPVLLVRYYNADDIIYYIFELFRQAQDEGFQTEKFIKGMKAFLKKMFRYPYISKGHLNQKTLDKPVKLFYSDDARFDADYFYFTQRYDRYLDMQELIKDKDEDISLKNLLSKYYLNQINKEELTGWLALSKSNEGKFLYHLLTDSLGSLPQENPYKAVADLYTLKASHQNIINKIGEEGIYTLIMRILGFYPYDKTLINLADLRFEI